MTLKRRGARIGSRAGVKLAPKAGRVAGKTAWRLGKAEARLARKALSSREPAKARFLKYGLFTLVGVGIGALLGRSKGPETSSSFTDTTGHHAPDAESPAGQRGQTWGTGTPTGTAGGAAGAGGAEPLIGERHDATAGDVPQQPEEVEQRIRSDIGTDPRTTMIPRINVEVNDGVAELRGEAPSEEAKQAAGEIAGRTQGVREVRNLLTVNPESPTRDRSAGEADRPT